MDVRSEGILGYYNIILWDDEEKYYPIWSDIVPVHGSQYNSYFPSPFTNTFGGKTTNNLIGYEGEFHYGTLVSDYDALQIIAYGLGGSSISVGGPGMPPLIFEVDTLVFKPDYIEKPNLDTNVPDLTFAHLCSPGELRIYDSQGRVTGLVNGEINEEIPNSKYNDEQIMIPSSSNLFNYEVHGTDEGTYGLGIATLRDMESINFAAADIPISPNEINRYIIDWSALSQGENGVIIQIDINGDGIIEKTITSDDEFTKDEFILQTETSIEINPNTLNLKSNGEWITAYIELPVGYDVNNIDVSTIMLDSISVDSSAPTTVGDFDSDSVPDIMVKFNRLSVVDHFGTIDYGTIDYLIDDSIVIDSYIDLTITGQLIDGTSFGGSDDVRIMDRGK